MRKNSYLTFTDQFCGAGGSSQGVRRLAVRKGGGLEVRMALNHWDLAIKTHNTNFPDTDHDCTDVSACDPRRYPSTDFLITSPECTNHTLAKGVKVARKQMELYTTGKIDAAAERSRATMWDVCRFAEYHKYNYIIVENVWDAYKWVLFEDWLKAMHTLGYNHRCIFHNSMFSWPTPQSRDRMYIHFWRKGNKAPDLDYTPVSWCSRCEKDIHAVQSWKDKQKKFGVYGIKRGQYVYCCPTCSTIVEPYYYSAINCIDWSIQGEKIANKKLSPNSLRRIEYGYNKFADKPFLVTSRYGSGIECRVKDIFNDVMPTQPASIAHYLVNPMFVKMEHMSASDNSYVYDGQKGLPTQTTSMSMSLVMQPFLTSETRTGIAKQLHNPLNTQCTVTKQALISHESINSFLSYYYRTHQATHATEPVRTFAGRDSHCLISMPGKKVPLEECTYRMLQPHEVQLGMAFDRDYIVLGNKEEKVKQLGNAVTPPAMEWQIERAIASLN